MKDKLENGVANIKASSAQTVSNAQTGFQSKLEIVIKQLNKELSNQFSDFQGIYLYGLFADFKPHDEEDIELVGIFECENKEKREQIWPIVGKIETEFDVFIDFYPITKDELEKDQDFFEDVVIRGIFYKLETAVK